MAEAADDMKKNWNHPDYKNLFLIPEQMLFATSLRNIAAMPGSFQFLDFKFGQIRRSEQCLFANYVICNEIDI